MAGSGSGKGNWLFNLMSHPLEIEKIYLYAKDTYEAKYQLLINKRESTGLKHFTSPKDFIYKTLIKLMIFIKIFQNTI